MARSPSRFNLAGEEALIFLGDHSGQVADPVIEASNSRFAPNIPIRTMSEGV